MTISIMSSIRSSISSADPPAARGDRYLTSRFSQRQYAAWLATVTAIGLAARLFYFRLTIGSDDQRWVLSARQLFADRVPDLGTEYYARIVWRFVLRLWGLPFGVSLESSAVLMCLLYLVAIFAVAYVARVAFGREAAVVAAAVVATHPLNLLWDTTTLPDGLGVAMLVVGLALYVTYLQSDRLGALVGAGLLIGLTISVKEYFVLLALPCLVVLMLMRRARRRTSWTPILTFILALVLAVGIDFTLDAIDAHPFAHWRAQASYGDRILAYYTAPSPNATGIRLAAALAEERSFYVQKLFFDQVGTGLLMLWGLLVLAIRIRSNPVALIVIATIGVLLAFLSLMPAKLHPLIFTVMQDRYLTVVLPFTAIAAGVGVATILRSLADAAERRALLIIVAVVCVVNLFVPNSSWDVGRTVEFAGMRQTLVAARGRGITELILPTAYWRLTPDRYYTYGARLTFTNFSEPENVRDYLQKERTRALFLPRYGYADWRPPGFDESRQPSRLAQVLSTGQFDVEEVAASSTPLRAWLARIGFETRGHLVGWLYRAK
jgi:hypothetical protein